MEFKIVEQWLTKFLDSIKAYPQETGDKYEILSVTIEKWEIDTTVSMEMQFENRFVKSKTGLNKRFLAYLDNYHNDLMALFDPDEISIVNFHYGTDHNENTWLKFYIDNNKHTATIKKLIKNTLAPDIKVKYENCQ
jgi:hypothetical protein